MVMCEICNKEFQYPWMLRRHLARKKSCNSPNATENDSSRTENDSSRTEFDSSRTENDSSRTEFDSSRTENDSWLTENESLTKNSTCCQYCNKEFSRINNKNVHEKTCKFKDDEITKLEIECKVKQITENSNTCRFCKCNYSSNSNLTRHLATCAKKQEYKVFLEDKLKQMQSEAVTTINNTNNRTTYNNSHNRTTNNNNLTNNNNCTTINVNVLGEESLTHVTLKKIQTILKNIIQNKYPGDNNLYKLSAETVADVHKLIRENEANQNIIIPHERREVALIKRNPQSGFVKDDMNSVLDDGFRNTSKKLCDAMKSIEGPKKTQKIHKCVESFSKKGFRGHPEMPRNSGGYVHRHADVNHAKRRFKLANMYIPTNNNESESENESENESEIIHDESQNSKCQVTVDTFPINNDDDIESWLCN